MINNLPERNQFPLLYILTILQQLRRFVGDDVVVVVVSIKHNNTGVPTTVRT